VSKTIHTWELYPDINNHLHEVKNTNHIILGLIVPRKSLVDILVRMDNLNAI